MQADDLTTMARVAAMRDLTDLRALTQEHAVVSAAITRHDELLDEAAAERETLVSELASTLPAALMQDAASALPRLFSRIEVVARARADALAAWDRLDASMRDIAEAKADSELDRQELAAAMQAAGLDGVDGTLAEMLEAAEAAVAGQTKRAAAREAADKALADRKRALAERQREFEQAQAASVDWHARFTTELSGTWFADVTSAGAVREVLETLVELGPALNERDELARRIATMERDREDFTTELSVC